MKKNLGRKTNKQIRPLVGFTLVEIMIVVCIIGLLAALSITGVLRTRLNVNESLAIDTLRLISASCEMYRYNQTPNSFPLNLTALGNTTPPYLDSTITSATTPERAKRGYYYTYTYVDPYRYTCIANPSESGVTGTKTFFVDQAAIIKIGDVNGAPVGG